MIYIYSLPHFAHSHLARVSDRSIVPCRCVQMFKGELGEAGEDGEAEMERRMEDLRLRRQRKKEKDSARRHQQNEDDLVRSKPILCRWYLSTLILIESARVLYALGV